MGLVTLLTIKKNTIVINQNSNISRTSFLRRLSNSLYSRATSDLSPGSFRVTGDVVDISLSYRDCIIRVNFFGDHIESIDEILYTEKNKINQIESISIYPANMFSTQESTLLKAIDQIQIDLGKQVDFFKSVGKNLEAKRLNERTLFDIEMMQELGYCSGIENYSRYIDGREPGTRPFCLIDYFPDEFLTVIDESHVTIPQIRAMYGGDRSRKENLVEYGFRLPSAMDNRPLNFEEFEGLQNQVIFVSATPSDYELNKSEGIIVEQVIRPTGLLDPEIEIRSTENQIDDVLDEVQKQIEKNQRVLITTLTKKMAEELVGFLNKVKVKSKYIHSDIDTIERVEILNELRSGAFDVLVGVNLLREGLDLPEVSLVIILDADKEGFLRSKRSLIQTIGRAARNINGKAIMYADKETESINHTLRITLERRKKQMDHNIKNGITPKQIIKNVMSTFDAKEKEETNINTLKNNKEFKIDINISDEKRKKIISDLRKEMVKAAKDLDFIEAAKLRDLIDRYKKSG